jgi:hypothetical protein
MIYIEGYKLNALIQKIKLEGGRARTDSGLGAVGWGPSRWATALLHILTISGRGHWVQNLGPLCVPLKSQVAATQNVPAGPLAHVLKVGDMEMDRMA